MDGMSPLPSAYELAPGEAERELRVQLAAAYRLVDHFGWTELIYGHLTVRCPGPDHHFLINPYGLNYDEVTASNLVKIDLEGNVIEGQGHGVNYAGFVIHSAIHMAKDGENRVVMHTHTRAGMAVAALEEGLLPISMTSTQFYDDIAYHDYEGISLYLNERERVLNALGEAKAMILRNHGLLTVGRTVPEAFLYLYRLERACQVQIDAAAAGTLRLLTDNVATRSREDLKKGFTEKPRGDIEFAALMRKLDKTDASYRN
jgi:ribulose-5-phosphate 4-epimerase/fuculose-1-phosphate aldolase